MAKLRRGRFSGLAEFAAAAEKAICQSADESRSVRGGRDESDAHMYVEGDSIWTLGYVF